MRTEEQNKMIHLALRRLGDSTESKTIVRFRSNQISGIWFAAMELGHCSPELTEIASTASRLYLFSDHRLPEFSNEYGKTIVAMATTYTNAGKRKNWTNWIIG